MKRIEIEQNTPEWLELRRTKIGGSDAAAIMDADPYKSSKDVWEQKVLGKQQYVTEAMQRGKDLEDVARQIFEKKVDSRFSPAVVISDEYEWMMASLDGISSRDEKVILEIKTVKPGCAEEDPRESWRWQIQHQLIVTGAKVAILFVFDGEDYKIHEIKKDEELCKLLIKKELEFYMKHMLGFEPPKGKLPIRNEPDLVAKLKRWKEIRLRLMQVEQEEEMARLAIVESAEDSFMCEGVKVEKRPGIKSVSYKMIPELKTIDLTLYTKVGEPYWKLTETSETC
jgi:putative phage-type endonuclease